MMVKSVRSEEGVFILGIYRLAVGTVAFPVNKVKHGLKLILIVSIAFLVKKSLKVATGQYATASIIKLFI